MGSKIIVDWIPGWKAVALRGAEPLREYQKECESIIHIGEVIFGLGAMPEIPTRGGTGGNIAKRDCFSVDNGFLVTASRTHKGKLAKTNNSILCVTRVDWEEKTIYFLYDDTREEGAEEKEEVGAPCVISTDSVLGARAYKKNPKISDWIHFHGQIAEHKKGRLLKIIKVKYPATDESHWQEFDGLVSRADVEVSAIAIGLTGHTKPGDDQDAVIVLGRNSGQALDLATSLIN